MAAGSGALLLPIPIVNGADAGIGDIDIPMFVVSGAGYVLGADSLQIPVPVVTGAAEVRESNGDVLLPFITCSGTGLTGVLGIGAVVLPLLSVGLASGPIGTAALTLPQFVVFDVAPGHAFGSITLPVPALDGFGRLLPISKVYQGMAMNIANQAVSTYSNFPFNSMVYFNGRYLGATDSGIYVLDGDTDNGTKINAKVKSGPINFGDGVIKYLRNLWLTFRSLGHLAVVLTVDENEDNPVELSHTTKVGNEITEERLKGPRGLKGRFYTLELKNLSGTSFDIDSLSILVEALRRKVR